MDSEEREIKSKQASKRDRTLLPLIIIKGFSPHCILTDLTLLKLTLDPIPIICLLPDKTMYLSRLEKVQSMGNPN